MQLPAPKQRQKQTHTKKKPTQKWYIKQWGERSSTNQTNQPNTWIIISVSNEVRRPAKSFTFLQYAGEGYYGCKKELHITDRAEVHLYKICGNQMNQFYPPVPDCWSNQKLSSIPLFFLSYIIAILFCLAAYFTFSEDYKKFRTLQRNLFSKSHRGDCVQPLLQALHWLPVQARIDYKLPTICHNFFSDSSPAYLSDLLTVYTSSRQLCSSADTRTLCILHVKTRTLG